MADSNARLTSFLGTGWSFPPEFVKQGLNAEFGRVRMTADEEDIRASLLILFTTGEGERFLNPRFGIDLRDQLFESLSTTARSYLVDRVRDGILIYEPRIDIIRLDLNAARELEGVIQLELEYGVRTTNSRYNLVFPFYRSDASEVGQRGRAIATPAA